jgi:ketosteroid isomerase-like protein
MSEESTTPDLFKSMRRTMVAFSQGDFEAQMSVYAPDAVLDMSARGLGIFEGLTAIRAFWEAYYSSFEDLRFELEEALDLGDGVVFAIVCQDARPAGSGARVRTREAWVSVWDRGVFMRGSSYADTDEARAAAELLAKERAIVDG